MAKNTTLLPVLATGGFIAWLLWSKGNAAEQLNYVLTGVGTDSKNGSPVIGLQITVQNPTNQQFFINAIVGTLYANGQSIANVSGFDKVPIAPASESPYWVYFRVNLAGTALAIYNLISQGLGTPQTLEFRGTINASGIVKSIILSAKVG